MAMTNKEIYQDWCEKHPEIPLFLQYDWMATIAEPQQWDVALVGAKNDVQAFMPYFRKSKLKFEIIFSKAIAKIVLFGKTKKTIFIF